MKRYTKWFLFLSLKRGKIDGFRGLESVAIISGGHIAPRRQDGGTSERLSKFLIWVWITRVCTCGLHLAGQFGVVYVTVYALLGTS